MIAPVLEATLYSLNQARIGRLGGLEKITLHDLARESREGHGDAGICFELAIHEAIASRHELIHPIVSEAIETFCRIRGGSDSILFGPEKNNVIPILESVQDALTDDSRVYVGNKGQPPKLKRYIPKIINAFFKHEQRNQLPRSIAGLWKADLFIGNKASEQWLGTSIKINPEQLVGAQGLRLGLYPQRNKKDRPRLDDDLNLVRVPLPYDGHFMEVFYKSFYLVRAFLRADAKVPPPVDLPDAEDRFITRELEQRRDFPVIDVLEVLRTMSQPDLIDAQTIVILAPQASISAGGLGDAPMPSEISDAVSIAPKSSTES